MIIGDHAFRSDGSSGQSCLFGVAEDEMLRRMMQAIDLKEEDVYVTNCIKCRPRPDMTPTARHGRACLRLLREEMAALRPTLVCCMGPLPTSLLLGKADPLIRLRGRLFKRRIDGVGMTTIVPTFHPRFLLSHPEMKRAVWLDLQMIRRRLGERHPTPDTRKSAPGR